MLWGKQVRGGLVPPLKLTKMLAGQTLRVPECIQCTINNTDDILLQYFFPTVLTQRNRDDV